MAVPDDVLRGHFDATSLRQDVMNSEFVSERSGVSSSLRRPTISARDSGLR